MDIKQIISAKAVDFSRAAVLRANYLLNNYREVIWLVGDGRSGTTWVADLINHDKKYLEMFEPFHAKKIPEMSFLVPHQYVRPANANEKLNAIASQIFHGTFFNKRVDSNNSSFWYKGILVKDIFANLLCYWATLQFPFVKPVLLIRNPFSVAISKYKKSNWFWETEPLNLLNQRDLHEDYLSPFEDLIKRVSLEENFLLNQILIWSIINYVPLRQFEPGKLHICFYENINKAPNQEIAKLFEFVRGTVESPAFAISSEVVNRPARTTGNQSNLVLGTSPVTSWKNELPPKLIDDGLKILQCFGLDNLYDEMSMPNLEALREVHESA